MYKGGRNAVCCKGARKQDLQKRASPALLAAVLPAPMLAEGAGTNAVFAKQLDATMLAYSINGTVSAVVLAPPVLAHAAASAIFALDASAAVLANTAAAAVLAKTLQATMLANVFAGAASALDIPLIPAAAAGVVHV